MASGRSEMIEWRAPGLLLAVRKHGESAAIIEVFTEAHGRQTGVVRGGGGRRMAAVLQPGASLDVVWRARLEEHLGNFTAELVRGRAGGLLGDRTALAGLASLTALCSFCLPERQAYPALFRQTETVLDLIGTTDLWPFAYLQWEAALLSEMGYGLDLTACAVTGATEGLVYVSPRSARAVTATGAGAWAERMLPLPACLQGVPTTAPSDVLRGLQTTGYFLEHRLVPAQGDKDLPAARARLIDALQRLAG